ncbi:hypothetical protein [Salegentibacter mishustinae]|uniref:hypothetical protein n=1 Tax=Salegentibacter mishustinae TaxID=270918 RepID=UPI002492461E|nr:hypothetical protein [Salegentibacter mishustinae]
MKKIIIILIFGFLYQPSYSQNQNKYLTSNEELIYELLPTVVDSMYIDFRLPIPLPPPIPDLNKKDSLDYVQKMKESWKLYYSEKERLKNHPTKISIGIVDTIRPLEISHLKAFKRELNVKIDSSNFKDKILGPIELERIRCQDKFDFKLASFYLNKDNIWQEIGEDSFMGIVSISNIVFDKTHSYGVFTATYGCGKLCGHCTRFYLKRVNGKWEIIRTKNYCIA